MDSVWCCLHCVIRIGIDWMRHITKTIEYRVYILWYRVFHILTSTNINGAVKFSSKQTKSMRDKDDYGTRQAHKTTHFSFDQI